ncbi:MAG: LysE family translocator [Reyranella sp.]
MVAVMAVVASGTAGLLLATPGVTPAVAILAAAYFLWLAWRIATAPPLSDEGVRREPPTLAAGLLQSLVNPKGYVAMAAVYSGFTLRPDRLGADMSLKLVMLTLVIAAVNVAWLLAGAALTRHFRNPRSNRLINLVFASALVGSVAVAFVV